MLDARRVIAGVVERGVTEHLEQPWEGPACPPFKASEAALAGNPR